MGEIVLLAATAIATLTRPATGRTTVAHDTSMSARVASANVAQECADEQLGAPLTTVHAK